MLPFHRRREHRDAATTEKRAVAGNSRGKGIGRFIVDWIKLSWRDILAMAVLGAASQGIYSAPLAATRTFPITFDTTGNVVYPDFAYPYRGWIISPALSGALSTVVPIAIIALAQIRIRSFWDANNGILGVLYAVILGTLFQVVLKQLIGGMRPYFLDVCQPDLSRVVANNATGLNGVGYKNMMYSLDVCTNPDRRSLQNAMTSFPSGHTTAAFAGYVYLFLWLNAKLKVWAAHQTSFYWLALLFAPLLGAMLMACALTIDAAHNWYDIAVGMIIGIVMAFAAYRITYAAIWDWRFNHIPLRRTEMFDYASGLVPETMERAVFIRKLGWGRRRRHGRVGEKRASRGVGSARSSATYARNGSTVSPHGNPMRYPEPTRHAEATRVRSNPHHAGGRVPGDEMV